MKLTLEGNEVEIEAPTFGNLRKIISIFNNMPKGGVAIFTEDDDSAAKLIGLLISKTPDEVNGMKISMREMVDAIAAVPIICGLEFKVAELGKTPVVGTVTETDLTQSTAT